MNGKPLDLTPPTPDDLPPEVRRLLDPITSLRVAPEQGMTSRVLFAEAAPGAVVIKQTGMTHTGGRYLPWLRQEAEVLEALAPLGLPVPEPLLFVEQKSERGPEGWLVMRRLSGISVAQALQAEVDLERRRVLLTELGQALARVHATPAPAALTVPGGDWLEEMLRQAAENLALYGTDGTEALLERLRRERPLAIGPALIHGDLFLDNVLVDGLRVSGLIDWSFGALGDPRYDLALALHELTPPEQRALQDGYGEAAELTEWETEYFLGLGHFF